jgi:CHAD domain-containing protein
VLRNLLASIHDNLPGTLDETDPEFLHDLRVALRRTRSVLAEGKGVLPDDVRARFRADFAELAAATGRARDLDVYVLGWSDMVEPLGPVDSSLTAPILVELERRRRAAHKELAKVFRRRETRELLESWRRWLDDPEVDDRSGGPIGAFIATRISKAQRGLLRDARAITPQSPAAQLHDLRKDAKKLRYLLECFESVLPAKASKKFIAQLKALQDNLGDHQDAEVQAAELRTLSHDLHARARLRADQLLAAGRLIDHLERTRQRERAEFTEHFAAYDTATNRSLLDAMLAKATKA